MTTHPPRGDAGAPDCPSWSITLDSASIEAIAVRVAELLRGEQTHGELVNATTLARVLGVSRGYVYEHADELGAVRLPSGGKKPPSGKKKARLRFDVERAKAARERLVSGLTSRRADAAQSRTATEKPRGRRRARSGTTVELLPIQPPATADREAS